MVVRSIVGRDRDSGEGSPADQGVVHGVQHPDGLDGMSPTLGRVTRRGGEHRSTTGEKRNKPFNLDFPSRQPRPRFREVTAVDQHRKKEIDKIFPLWRLRNADCALHQQRATRDVSPKERVQGPGRQSDRLADAVTSRPSVYPLKLIALTASRYLPQLLDVDRWRIVDKPEMHNPPPEALYNVSGNNCRFALDLPFRQIGVLPRLRLPNPGYSRLILHMLATGAQSPLVISRTKPNSAARRKACVRFDALSFA